MRRFEEVQRAFASRVAMLGVSKARNVGFGALDPPISMHRVRTAEVVRSFNLLDGEETYRGELERWAAGEYGYEISVHVDRLQSV